MPETLNALNLCANVETATRPDINKPKLGKTSVFMKIRLTLSLTFSLTLLMLTFDENQLMKFDENILKLGENQLMKLDETKL